MKNKKLIVGCEKSQVVTQAFRKLGIEAYSCDKQKTSGNNTEWHFHDDIINVVRGGLLKLQNGKTVLIEKWDGGIFFPDCTYLTCSAEWAYKEPPYHQKVKPETLTGEKRIQARYEAIEFFRFLWNLDKADFKNGRKNIIPNIVIENPIGIMSKFLKPSQIIQPYEFGDDASKATCLWVKGFPILEDTKYIQPRIVNGKQRWGNQTDSGQNKLPPSENRAELRGITYPGIAEAMAKQWYKYL